MQNIIHNGQFYTIFEGKLFDESQINKLFAFNYSLQKDEEVRHEKIDETGMINIYSVPKSLLGNQTPLSHRATALIVDTLEKSKQNNAKQLHIDIQAGFFYANIVENGRLLLSNAFSYNDSNELAYFVMALYSKFGLDPQKNPLIVSSCETEEGKAGLDILKDFVEISELCELSADN